MLTRSLSLLSLLLASVSAAMVPREYTILCDPQRKGVDKNQLGCLSLEKSSFVLSTESMPLLLNQKTTGVVEGFGERSLYWSSKDGVLTNNRDNGNRVANIAELVHVCMDKSKNGSVKKDPWNGKSCQSMYGPMSSLVTLIPQTATVGTAPASSQPKA